MKIEALLNIFPCVRPTVSVGKVGMINSSYADVFVLDSHGLGPIFFFCSLRMAPHEPLWEVATSPWMVMVTQGPKVRHEPKGRLTVM